VLEISQHPIESKSRRANNFRTILFCSFVRSHRHCEQGDIRMLIRGACHCRAITFELSLEPAPERISARTCSCSFCLKHGGIWTASPTASLRVHVARPDQVSHYQFGTRTADFLVCRICGVVPLVTSCIGGREYAVVNVNAFEDVPASMISHSPVSFDGEGEGDRLARRAQHWIADVLLSNDEV
jgi:hypothetical protein